MDVEALFAVGSVVVVIGAVLLVICLLGTRYFLRQRPSSRRIRVTAAGFSLCLVQIIGTFVVVGVGFFQPQTLLGRVVAHPAGVPAIIALFSLVFWPISALLQRRGVVLYYRQPSGG